MNITPILNDLGVLASPPSNTESRVCPTRREILHACDPVMSQRQSYRFVTQVPEPTLADVRATTARLTYAHAWKPRDVIALDNSRVMHGRRRFRGTREMMAVNGKLFGPGRALQRFITDKGAPPIPWREIAPIP